MVGSGWMRLYKAAWKKENDDNNIPYTDDDIIKLDEKQYTNGYMLGLLLCRVIVLMIPKKSRDRVEQFEKGKPKTK